MPVCNKECVDKYLPFIFLFFLIIWNAKSQSFYLKIDEKLPFSYKTTFKDSTKVLNELDNVIFRLREKGYLLANADKHYFYQDTFFVTLYKGEKFKWVNVQTDEIQTILQKIGQQNMFYSHRKINYKQFLKVEKQLLNYANNHGFPFAHLSFEPTKITDFSIEGKWHYEPHTLFTFDTLIIQDVEIHHDYLQHVLTFKKGEFYKKKKIDDITKAIQKLGFVELQTQVQVQFQKNIFKIIVSLKKKQQNELNGLVGFLPNQNNQIQLTGDVKLHLVNLFKRGIQTDIFWKKQNAYSQQLHLNYQHPFLLNTILSPNFQLNLQKQDSTFLSVERKMNFDFFISSQNKITIGLNYKTSQNLLQKQDSIYQDFSNLSYLFVYQFQNTDNFFYPKKGYFFESKMSIGQKKLRQKEENLLQNTWQTEWNFLFQYYLKIYKKTHLLCLVNYQGIENFNNQLWENDLFQFGGFQTLRGFNENQFRASQWVKMSVEPRYWFDETSFFYTFFEKSYFVKYDNENWLNSVGVGIQLQVKNGIFNFATALGQNTKQKEVSINLFKVHFGLITKF